MKCAICGTGLGGVRIMVHAREHEWMCKTCFEWSDKLITSAAAGFGPYPIKAGRARELKDTKDGEVL